MNDPKEQANYGHTAIVEVRVAMIRIEEREISRKGPASRVRYAAKLMSGYQRVVSIEGYTEEAWLRWHGEGRM